MLYQCPLCQQKLQFSTHHYRCHNNHQFDQAKEGYVNLMPAHHKHSKNPGDNKEMMQARRQFLESNHYQPMQEMVARYCADYLGERNSSQNGSKEINVLDIGCGEGYYTAAIEQQLSNKNCHTYGLDISKIAIKFAAKRYPHCQFSVASSHRLPFPDESLDAITRIYAPCDNNELLRVIKKGGFLFTVTPASHHLYQLRKAVYKDVHLHDEMAESITGFTLIKQDKLTYEMQLNGEEALRLLNMTPFAWKATPELKALLIQEKSYPCKADFMIRVYQKKEA